MIRRIKNEWKIAGSNLVLISVALVAFLVLLALCAGELLDVGGMGFEVVFPFYAAVAVGEWGKTRSDENYDVIAAQGKSVFGWLAVRYVAVMGAVSAFAVAGMAAVSLIRGGMTFAELLAAYFPTAFLLSSLSMWVGLRFEKEHSAAMACGVAWLAALMARGLLRFRAVQYVYPFIRFAGVGGDVWIINKCVLLAAGAAMWALCAASEKGGSFPDRIRRCLRKINCDCK